MTQVEADDAGPKSECLRFLFGNFLGQETVVCRLSEVNDSIIPSDAIVVSLIEAESPLFASINQTAMTKLKIITDRASRILWVTSGGLLRCPNPDFALASGLARTLMLEQPSLSFFTFDVAREQLCLPQTARNMVSVLTQDLESFPEYEFVQDNGVLHASRFVPDDRANETFRQKLSGETISMSLKEASPGRLTLSTSTTTFFLRREFVDSIPLGSVEVETKTVGLNSGCSFSINEASGNGEGLRILEFCGIVTRVAQDVTTISPGDPVVAMAPCNLETHQVVPAWACMKLKPDDKPDVVCTLPYTYSTVLYALKTRAQIAPGERILIHRGASPVGMAAIRIAQLAGAHIFATVGSESEKDLLVSRYQLDASHIYSYHDNSFATAIMAATEGLGVDVVLNLLPGPMLHDTWRTCASFGRFIELGNRDLMAVEKLDMDVFKRNVTFSAVNLIDVFHDSRPQSRATWST